MVRKKKYMVILEPEGAKRQMKHIKLMLSFFNSLRMAIKKLTESGETLQFIYNCNCCHHTLPVIKKYWFYRLTSVYMRDSLCLTKVHYIVSTIHIRTKSNNETFLTSRKKVRSINSKLLRTWAEKISDCLPLTFVCCAHAQGYEQKWMNRPISLLNLWHVLPHINSQV